MNTLFSTYPAGAWDDGTTHRGWHVEPSGGQRVAVFDGTLELDAAPAGTLPNTFASLVTSVQAFTSWSQLVVDYTTVEQHRDVPNPWETGWVLFNFTDTNHFYSALLKTNGWEIAKEWPDSNGVQRQDFLGYANQPFPVGRRYKVRITCNVVRPGVRIRLDYRDVTANGQWTTLATVDDPGDRPSGPAYTTGKVGLYCEDSRTRYYSVTIT